MVKKGNWWGKLQMWKKGAILGSIFGIIGSYIPLLWWYGGGGIVSFIPPTPSLYSLGFYYYLLLLAIFWTLIGAIVGYLIDKYKR